ncbi:MAG: hypothetical protein WCY32_03125 [Burkholderiaceae bacterium]
MAAAAALVAVAACAALAGAFAVSTALVAGAFAAATAEGVTLAVLRAAVRAVAALAGTFVSMLDAAVLPAALLLLAEVLVVTE